MKQVLIEWRHLDVAGETCDRCYDTGENLKAEVNRLNRALSAEGVVVEWFETKLDATEIDQSNMILINGLPIESIVELSVAANYCGSCSDLVGSDSYCRSVVYGGKSYDDVPTVAIRDAVYKVLNLSEKPMFSVL